MMTHHPVSTSVSHQRIDSSIDSVSGMRNPASLASLKSFVDVNANANEFVESDGWRQSRKHRRHERRSRSKRDGAYHSTSTTSSAFDAAAVATSDAIRRSHVSSSTPDGSSAIILNPAFTENPHAMGTILEVPAFTRALHQSQVYAENNRRLMYDSDSER